MSNKSNSSKGSDQSNSSNNSSRNNIRRAARNQKLAERLERFAHGVAELIRKLPRTETNIAYGKQVIRSSASMGSNYHEACGAESSRDFVHKIKIILKETRETRYWLRMLYKVNESFADEISKLGKECVELLKIFATIVSRFKKKERK